MAPHFRVFGSYNILYNQSMDEFMTSNPPCKECLIQVMCLKPNNKYSFIKTRSCAILNEFILANKYIKMTLG
jgi:hypothetical protein